MVYFAYIYIYIYSAIKVILTNIIERDQTGNSENICFYT